ncbi:MAG: histidinol-phosphatase [Bacteroidales bacterium]|nr:histidinol-phosphatase [Bacteroidales bacterium]
MYNFHTHTTFCDGKAAPEAFVKKALDNKMKVLGFSAHAPLPFSNAWSLKTENLNAYFESIEILKAENADNICILKALEADFIPDISTAFSYWRTHYKVDYIIGSIHLVKIDNSEKLWFIDGPAKDFDSGINNLFNGNVQKAVQCFFDQEKAMILQEKPDIVGHMDKIKMHNKGRFFNETEKWYINAIEDTLDVIAKKDVVVEVNSRGVYTGKCPDFYPGIKTLELCLKKNIAITLNSDAHRPEELLGKYSEAISMLKDIGFKKLTIFTTNGRGTITCDEYMNKIF